MRKYYKILTVMAVMAAIATPLLAVEGSGRDARDLKYLYSNTALAESAPLLTMEGSHRDARDLKFLSNNTAVSSSTQVLAWIDGPKDARDLKYIHSDTSKNIDTIEGDESVRCLYSNHVHKPGVKNNALMTCCKQ
jgi:hypothetical protein